MLSNKAFAFIAVFWFLTTPTRRLLHEMVGAFAGMLLFYGLAWLLLGDPDFVRSLHWIFRRQEPSRTDLKIARSVGYIGIFFGSIMLLALLIDLFNLLL